MTNDEMMRLLTEIERKTEGVRSRGVRATDPVSKGEVCSRANLLLQEFVMRLEHCSVMRHEPGEWTLAERLGTIRRCAERALEEELRLVQTHDPSGSVQVVMGVLYPIILLSGYGDVMVNMQFERIRSYL